jgi:hypothetical protein
VFEYGLPAEVIEERWLLAPRKRGKCLEYPDNLSVRERERLRGEWKQLKR